VRLDWERAAARGRRRFLRNALEGRRRVPGDRRPAGEASEAFFVLMFGLRSVVIPPFPRPGVGPTSLCCIPGEVGPQA
jgi:hypothetical protein